MAVELDIITEGEPLLLAEVVGNKAVLQTQEEALEVTVVVQKVAALE